nr:MAG TPA_asm: hypothetical protein [Caudoviricetes sp.]
MGIFFCEFVFQILQSTILTRILYHNLLLEHWRLSSLSLELFTSWQL